MPGKITIRNLSSAKGYQADFLGSEYAVPLPRLNRDLRLRVAPVMGDPDDVLHYQNYSVVQHADRRFPIFTASNIDGHAFVDLSRKDIFPGGRDRWRKDPRLDSNHQWGQELYSAAESRFDRGHMTRREDVQWGSDPEEARAAAQSTFFFTNSVPQHPNLNRAIWSDLEDYILHEEAVGFQLRINLFTGPVLRDDDPIFITPVRGENMQLPTLFWKVVYFLSPKGRLQRVGFLIGQHDLLEREGIVTAAPASRSLLAPSLPDELLFVHFKEADTYQVRVNLIEKLTGLRFPRATDPLHRRRSIRLTLEETEAPEGSRGLADEGGGGAAIKGLVLG